MPIEIRRKENETVGSMLRRFSRRVQQSGILLRARKIRFYEEDATKRQKKETALHRMKVSKEMEKLRKLGKLKEEKRR